MNRLFTLFIGGSSFLLICFFILLLGSMLAELFSQSFLRPPDLPVILFATKLSLWTATIAAIIALALATPVAYMFSRSSFFGKTFFDTLLDLPIVLSPIAVGAMLLIFFNTSLGVLLERWLGPFVFEVKGIMLAQFMVIIGLAIRLLKAAFEDIDVEYEHLARSLGCHKMATFFKVLLPMAKKNMLASFLLIWGRAIGEFGATVTLAGATTMKTETLPVAIYLNFESVDISSAIVFILILIGISLAILFFARKLNANKHWTTESKGI